MAAPCDQWNSKELIPPPTNLMRINFARFSDGEHFHICDSLKSTLQSIYDGKDLNGSLLKGELITLSRFLYKNKNSQRSWKLYGLLVKLKKCLERLAETTIHSYAGIMLSAWDNSLEPPTPITSLPSRQMLEYLCVSLQGCAKLCVYIATLCEQAALIMIETVHSGMFLSSNLVFLAIVSRVRVLICNFFKSTVGWYDNLITARSSLPSTNSEWLHKDTQLPTSLMEWLGEEATRLTLDITSSKNTSDLSILDRLFNTSLEISMDTHDEGERKVTAVSQLKTIIPATIPDLGEKLSRADLATLVMARSKQGTNQLNTQVSPRKGDRAFKRRKVNTRMTSPPRKRGRTEGSGSWCHAQGRQPLQGSRQWKQKLKLKGLGSKKVWPRSKWNIGHTLRYTHVDNTCTVGSKKRNRSWARSKAKGLASNILTAVMDKGGKVRRRTSVASQRIGSASRCRRSMSRESTTSSHSGASQNSERGKKLQKHISEIQRRRKRSRSCDKSSESNSLVIRNTALSVTLTCSSAKPTAVSLSQDAGNGSCGDRSELFKSSPSHVSTSNGGRKMRASTSSITQSSRMGTSTCGNMQLRERNSVYLEPTRHKHKASNHVAKEQGLPDTVLPNRRYEPSEVGRVQSSTSKPARTVSLLGVEPKKRKLVKRLKKLKQKVLGKRRTKGSMQNVPDSSLHYANQISNSQGSPMQAPRHQPYNLLHRADGYYHIHQDSRLQHHPGNKQQSHHQGNKHQRPHQASKMQHHLQDTNQQYHVSYSDHHGHQQAPAHQMLPRFKHHQMFTKKGQRSHQTHLPKHGGVSNHIKRNKTGKGDTDQDMDSIFASLL